MNYDKLLVKILMNRKVVIIEKMKLLDSYPNIKTYIENRYDDSDSIHETIRRLNLVIEEKPKCPICGGPVNFIGKKSKMFSKYCSNSCRAKEYVSISVAKQKEYNLKHYGVEHNFQIKKCIEKRKETLIEKYGTTNLHNVPEISERTNKTISKKIDEYLIEHPEISRDDLGEGFSALIKMPEIQEKRNKTMSKNGTFNSSTTEDKSYELLLEKYPDVIRQYRSKEYPFNCDFYIPSLDLYIECQYSWYHGGHPYNPQNKDDVEKFNNWQIRYNGKYGDTWTIRDVNKRNTAKENNLNFIEFFKISELESWLEQN